MTTASVFTIECDNCHTKNEGDSYKWARVDVSHTRMSNYGWVSLGPDQHFDYCPECWKTMVKVLRAQRS